jgi:hypothetical protein
MGNYSGLGDSKTRRQEESIVEKVEMRSYYWAGRQLDRETWGIIQVWETVRPGDRRRVLWNR